MINNIVSFTAETSKKLKDIFRLTDMVAVILLIAVGIAVIYLAVSLVILNKKTKRPKKSVKSYDNYLTAQAKITSVEKEPYYVKPYERKTELKTAVEKITADEVIYLTKKIAEKTEEEKVTEVEKFRYKVTYTFSTKEYGSGFYGEFYVYEESDDIKEGKTIEVKYDPDKPQLNFTEYSKPIV